MAVIADRCPEVQVTVVDINQTRIDAWNDSDLSKLPIFEPGLDAVVGRARGRNLHFSTDVEEALESPLRCIACFITRMEVLYRVWKDEGERSGRWRSRSAHE